MRINVQAYDVLDRLEVRMSIIVGDLEGHPEHFSGYTRTFDYDVDEDLEDLRT